MGKPLLVWRLVVKDMRHHVAEALLLLLAIAAAAATLTLGLSIHGATNNPYEQTRSATNGPDVVDTEFPPNNGPANPATLKPLEHASGVVASSGPFPVTWATLRWNGTSTAVEVEGRDVGAIACRSAKGDRRDLGAIRRCRGRARLRHRTRCSSR